MFREIEKNGRSEQVTEFPNTYAFARFSAKPVELLWLANHPDCFVRMAAISREDTPTHTLLHMLYEDDPVVCGVAVQGLLDRMRRRKGPFLMNDPAEVLGAVLKRALQGNKDDWFLQSIFAKEWEDPDTLRVFFKNGGWIVLLALANNPDCPSDILQALSILPEERSNYLPDKNKEIRILVQKRLGITKNESELNPSY